MSNSEPNAVPSQSTPREELERRIIRTDAVKEAIALAERHRHCVEMRCEVADHASTRDDWEDAVRDCSRSRKYAPLLAALAEAERKLADANACSTCGGMAPSSAVKCVCGGTNSREHEIDGLRNCIYGAEAKLANAEKRAKEAEDDAELKGLELGVIGRDIATITGWLEMERAASAALTRKLATATEGITLAIDEYGRVGSHVQALDRMRKALVDTLAAIDAPAGEEVVSPSDWCLAVTCPSCGARCQRKSGHGFGMPHAGACAADCYNALPPEPANAQGSEACVLCGEHAEGNGCDCDCHEDDPLPTFAPSSPPPFTPEEVRRVALVNDGIATKLRGGGNDLVMLAADCAEIFDAPAVTAVEHARVASSLRHYATMLDRDGALERAAEEVLREFDVSGTGSRFLGAQESPLRTRPTEGEVMDAKVTVGEMVAAIDSEIRDGCMLGNGPRLEAARDYILAADAQLAERDAAIDALGRKATSLENDREYNAELVRERDAQIKRAEALVAARDAQIGERELQIAEMRKVTDGIATFVEEYIVDRIGVVEARRVRLLIESRTGFEPRKNPGPQSAELGLEANDE